MKIYQAFAFLSLFIMLFYNCSLPADDEEKGDLEGEDTITPELPWEGEMDKFTIYLCKKYPLGIWSSPHL